MLLIKREHEGRIQTRGWEEKAKEIMSSVLDVIKLVCPWGIQIKMLSEGLKTYQRTVELVTRIKRLKSAEMEAQDLGIMTLSGSLKKGWQMTDLEYKSQQTTT